MVIRSLVASVVVGDVVVGDVVVGGDGGNVVSKVLYSYIIFEVV